MPDGTEHATDAESIVRGLSVVRERIATAARSAGREPTEVRLVAVSKLQPVTAIQAAADAGQVDFGESRGQELVAKLDAAPATVRWHFVGQLQRNKVSSVVGRVALIHSVDRISLAETIALQASRRDVRQHVLVQVNIAGESRKAGCAPSELEGLLERIGDLDGIEATGLMTIPALDDDPAPVFAQLRAFRARLAPSFPRLAELSMGMSADLETAVAHGATIVRVGTAIFGARPRNR